MNSTIETHATNENASTKKEKKASPSSNQKSHRGVIMHGSLNVGAWIDEAKALGYQTIPGADGQHTELWK